MSDSIGRLVSIEFIGRLVGQLSQYTITLVLARTLGADGLGTFAFALVVLQLLGAVARGGLDTAMLKFVPIDRDCPARLTGTILIALGGGIILGITLLLTAWAVGFFIPELSHFRPSGPVGLMLLGLPLFTLVKITESSTRGFNETKYGVYIRELGMRTVGLGLITVAAVSIKTVESVIVAFLVAIIIAVIMGIVFMFRLGAFNAIQSPTFKFRRIIVYALPVAGVAIASPIIIWTDILMLGFLRESSSVGFYRAAYRTAALLTFALISVNAIFPSIASSLYDAEAMNKLEDVYSTVTLLITGLTLFAASFAVVFSSEILNLFGAEFAVAKTALIVLVVSRVIDAGVGPAGFMLSMTDNERLEFINSIIIAFLNILLNYFLIARYGLIGAAIATTTSLSLLNIVRLFEVHRMLGIWPHSLRSLIILLPVSISTTIMIIIKSALLQVVLQLLLGGLLSFTVFVILLWMTVVTEDDIILLTSNL